MCRMAWRDPTPAEVETIEHVTAVVAQAHDAGPPPAIAGHLRVVGDAGPRDLLLGARTALDGPVAILDWRTAPLAEVFFRHAPGEPYELDIDDRTVAGRVAARHQLELAGGAVVAIASDTVE